MAMLKTVFGAAKGKPGKLGPIVTKPKPSGGGKAQTTRMPTQRRSF